MHYCEDNQPIDFSVIIPAYNEHVTLEEVTNQVLAADLPGSLEIIIVNDGSNDGTAEIARRLEANTQVRVFHHERNCGKAASLRTGFRYSRGRVVVVQDADLEYNPRDISRLVQPILDGRADVVFGSRFRGEAQRVHLFLHRIANFLLTTFSNLSTNLNLSDMECGYKAFRSEVLDKVNIREDGFGFEPEITVKVAKQKYRIYEVPVSYSGRDYSEGKKIGLKDAFRALWCIIRYRIAD